MKQGICTNLPSACSKAAAHERLDIHPTMRCPECGKPLLPAPGGGAGFAASGGRRIGLGLAAVAVVGIAGAAGWALFGKGEGGTSGNTSASAPAAAAAGLRIDGVAPASALLGAVLAEGFLRGEGATSVTRQTGDTALHFTLTGDVVAGKPRSSIDVRARGAAEALRQLRAGTTDLVVLNRPLSSAEREELHVLGDLGAPANEIIVALDGVAVIVAPSNPISQITVTQLRDIYAGRLTQWNQLPGSTLNGPIKAYAGAPSTAAWETFRGAAMGGGEIADGVSRIDNPEALLRSVATDANAIGFVPLQHAHTAKVLPVGDGAALAMAPNRLSIATEDYALTQRLYLYVPPHARSMARRFAEFAASELGQSLVEQAGFIGQVPAAHGPEALRLAAFPAAYLQGVQGGRRLSVNLRFKPGSVELDNKAQRDIDRIVRLLRAMPAGVMLVAMVEDGGNAKANDSLSGARADAAARALAASGVKSVRTRALGATVVVAGSARLERNRRVEVWLTDAAAPAAASPPVAAAVAGQPAPLAPVRVAPAPTRVAPPPTRVVAAPARPAAPPPAAAPAETGGPSIVLKPGK